MQPLVSIIIPSHNRMDLLPACLNSIYAQDTADLGETEIIVVDDSSVDGTWDFLTEEAKKHPELKPIHAEVRNVSKARNLGLDAATGLYIRFVDSDDELPPDSMRRLITACREGDSALAIGAFDRRSGQRITKPRVLFKENATHEMKAFAPQMIRVITSYTVGVVWNKLFRRDIIEARGLRFVPGLTYGEDFLFVMQYLPGCKRVSTVTDSVYRYYFNPKSLTTGQVMSCVTHPLVNIRCKKQLFDGYRGAFKELGLYEQHRRRIDSYMWLVNLYDN